MWGRELRAGTVFVLVSVAAGGAFRGWQRSHTARFDDLVASLVEADAREGAGAAGSGARDVAEAGSASPGAGSAPPAPASIASRGARRPGSAPPRAASLDVDRASVDDLIRLPGIGPALAARIVADRVAHGAFGGPEGLLRVPGIGVKTLARIRGFLRPAREAPDSADSASPSAR